MGLQSRQAWVLVGREKEEGGPGGRKRMGAMVDWLEWTGNSKRLSSTEK